MQGKCFFVWAVPQLGKVRFKPDLPREIHLCTVKIKHGKSDEKIFEKIKKDLSLRF